MKTLITICENCKIPYDCCLELFGEGHICNQCFCKKMQELDDEKSFEIDDTIQQIIKVGDKRYKFKRIEPVIGTHGLSICYEPINF